MNDLTKITPRDREVALRDPRTDKELGLLFVMRSRYSDEVREAERRWQNARFARMNKRGGSKGLTAEGVEALRINLIVASVKTWRWTDPELTIEGQQPEFSPQNLKRVMDMLPWVREFLDDELGDDAAFFSESPTSSPKRSSTTSTGTPGGNPA